MIDPKPHRKVQTLEQLQQRAKLVAASRGYPQHADDFAQEVALKFLEQPGRHSTLDQLFIDYLRETFGHTRTEYGRIKSRALRSFTELSPRRHPRTYLHYDDRLARVTAVLPPTPKRVVELYWQGWTMKEIGEQLELTETRICQLISAIKRKPKVRALIREHNQWN